MKDHKILLYGVHLFAAAALFFLAQAAMFVLGWFWPGVFKPGPALKLADGFFLIGLLFVAADSLSGAMSPRKKKSLLFDPVSASRIAVGMTAYNDELSICDAGRDFLRQEHVAAVVVVDNNSVDRTTEEGLKSGAAVVKESVQGYGACCMRALREAMKFGDIICLVEGDGTFSGSDLKKLMAYVENADMVVGTRTTRELNTPDSQINPSLLIGNVLMAKLLQIRFRSVRLTDVGCTFRVIRKAALEKIIDQLTVTGNHFSCEMLLVALENHLMVIEIPLTLKKRVGESKGVGGNFFKAAATATDMWKLIMFR